MTDDYFEDAGKLKRKLFDGAGALLHVRMRKRAYVRDEHGVAVFFVLLSVQPTTGVDQAQLFYTFHGTIISLCLLYKRMPAFIRGGLYFLVI